MLQLKINHTKPVQENFLGVNAVYHGFAGMPDDAGRVYSEELCELEADRVKSMGIKIVRTYYKWWAWTRKDGWNWENETMQAFYRWCERMQKRGIDIAIHGGWCSPGDVNGTSWGGDGPFADKGVSFETACKNFAEFVSESIHQLIEVRGFTNIKYLMLFTEPQSGSGKIPDGYDAFTVWERASRTIHERLVKDHRRNLIKLIGPNENARSLNGPKMLDYAAKNANDFLDSYGCHIYSRFEAENLDSIHSGKRSIFFITPGHKIGQEVILKPNTEYILSAWARVYTEDYLRISGNLLLGAFTHPGDIKPGEQWGGIACFNAGGQPTDRFHQTSVGMFDPAPHKDTWFKMEHRFHSGDGGYAVIGLFYDIKNKGAYAYADDFSLCEVGESENLLKNPSFEEETSDWWSGYSTAVSYDTFNDWYLWGKTMVDIIPKDKGLWYDECNCLHKALNGYYTDPMHGVRYAMGTLGLMNAGVATSLIWTILDQQWPNNHTTNNDSFTDGVQHCGVVPMLNQSLVPHASFYAIQLLANFLGAEGTKVYAEEKGGIRIHSVLCELSDGNVTIAVVSMRNEPTAFSLELGRVTEKSLYRHVYDPEKVRPDEHVAMIPADFVIEAGQTALIDTIPANSLLIYTTVQN